jgi:chromate transport protein ChrA
MRDATLPIVLIVLGAVWLLNSLDWLPEVHWIWIVGLAGAGIAIMALDGITKSSVVAGPLLMLAGIMSFCRQYYGLGWRIIIPVMLIAAGMLMLVARSQAIPESRTLNRRFERKPQDPESHG